MRIAFQPAANFETVGLRHVDIQQNQIRIELGGHLQAGLPLQREMQLDRLGAQPGLKQRVHRLGIVND